MIDAHLRARAQGSPVNEEPRAADTRTKILEVSERLFAREGYAGAHLQAIAEQVGVQKTALYYYFPSKSALYTTVLEQMLGDFERCVCASLQSGGTHEERLYRLLDDFQELFALRPTYSKILIRVFVDPAQEVDVARILPHIRGAIGAVLDFFKEGKDAGAFRPISSRHFLQSMLGMTVFHFAAGGVSADILGLSDIFNASAVRWRQNEVRRLLAAGVLAKEAASARGED